MKQCGISEDGRYYYYAIRATKTDRSFNPYTKYFNISKVNKKENQAKKQKTRLDNYGFKRL